MTETNPETDTPQATGDNAPADPPAPPVVDPAGVLKAALKATADAERDEYLKATAPTREAKGYTERHQAYDRVRLAFIDGTAADTKADALKAAKALPAYAKVAAADIETRAI